MTAKLSKGLKRVNRIYLRWHGLQLPVYTIGDGEVLAEDFRSGNFKSKKEFWQHSLFGEDMCCEIVDCKGGGQIAVLSKWEGAL